MNKTILVVDDDKKIANLIEFRLNRQGYQAHSVYRGFDATEYVKRREPVLVMLDIRLPDVSGIEVLQTIRKNHPAVYVIMISAHADVKLAVECMKYGAYDFIEKPLTFPELDAKVRNVFDLFSLEEEVTMLKKELGEKYKYKSIVGKSPAMKKIFECIDIASKSEANVLIEGESGTGKELVARAIHFSGTRKDGPFIAVNCAAIPDNLLESELFGYERGAFTGAFAQRVGKFEQAEGGTLFLDEIGELPVNLQVKLLRVMQEREVERIGGVDPVSINARFITATNQNLRKLVQEGKFREDLYFRFNVFPIRIPPLRERREDIPDLLQYFISRRRGGGGGHVRMEAGALKTLCEHDWNGNVREVENFVERLFLIKGSCDVIGEEDLRFLETLEANGGSGPAMIPSPGARENVVGQAEKALFAQALRESGGNVSKASKMLQISRDTFYRKMKKYAIER